jgi:glycogen debranching enzyme
MSDQTVSILEGNTFVVSDRAGNVAATISDPQGLFAWDTRFLSRWVLTVDGTVPNVLSTDDLRYYEAKFFLVPGTGTIYVDADLSIIRTRAVGAGFSEDILIRNESSEKVELEVKLSAAADFADLFEVKDAQPKKGHLYQLVRDSRLTLGYRRGPFTRETFITSTAPAHYDNDGLTFNVKIDPHGEWRTRIDVEISLGGLIENRTNGERPQRGKVLDVWLKDSPTLRGDWAPMNRIYTRSLIDLAALRFEARAAVEGALPAAGLPWFMSIFGRDSVITSFQALPFVPELARTTLRALARWQGTRMDDFRDEEPGKIMHELRYGELTAFEERPQSPYYGAADATPLFLILLDEYSTWTGDQQIVRDLELEAKAALAWIDEYGDHNKDGYVDYQRRLETGLENQCWKDSWNSILFRDGSNSRLPRATCEIQGYVYDAKRRLSDLAGRLGDAELSAKLAREAAKLQRHFEKAFWMEDVSFYAIALDADKKQVGTIGSNPGHCLWSGIVSPERVNPVVDRLLDPSMDCGWGIRTYASGQPGYNPVGYHTGTVWPHDNALIAAGMKRAGRHDAADRVASRIFEAAQHSPDFRLPELFCGFDRGAADMPVPYPVACSPQAWAAATPLFLLQTMLGMRANAADRILELDRPHLPSWLGKVTVHELQVGDQSVDLLFHRWRGNTTSAEVLRRSGSLQLVIRV